MVQADPQKRESDLYNKFSLYTIKYVKAGPDSDDVKKVGACAFSQRGVAREAGGGGDCQSHGRPHAAPSREPPDPHASLSHAAPSLFLFTFPPRSGG